MKRKRRQHSAEFKARVALEALRGIMTVNQVAEENEIHPVQVSQRKAQLQERLPEVLPEIGKMNASRGAKRSEANSSNVKWGNCLLRRGFSKKSANSWGSI